MILFRVLGGELQQFHFIFRTYFLGAVHSQVTTSQYLCHLVPLSDERMLVIIARRRQESGDRSQDAAGSRQWEVGSRRKAVGRMH